MCFVLIFVWKVQDFPGATFINGGQRRLELLHGASIKGAVLALVDCAVDKSLPCMLHERCEWLAAANFNKSRCHFAMLHVCVPVMAHFRGLL